MPTAHALDIEHAAPAPPSGGGALPMHVPCGHVFVDVGMLHTPLLHSASSAHVPPSPTVPFMISRHFATKNERPSSSVVSQVCEPNATRQSCARLPSKITLPLSTASFDDGSIVTVMPMFACSHVSMSGNAPQRVSYLQYASRNAVGYSSIVRPPPHPARTSKASKRMGPPCGDPLMRRCCVRRRARGSA